MYVAILSIIGVVLSNYFVAALTAQKEHDRRDDLASSAQNISAALNQDALTAVQLLDPAIAATSSVLMLNTPLGTVLYQQNGSTFNRIMGSSTVALVHPLVHVRSLWFTAQAYAEQRLHATTTSVQYHILLEHSTAAGMTRSIDGTLLIGKDVL